jgi:purine-binding chemotaxis protein CheW
VAVDGDELSSIVIFRLGGEPFALSVADVREVVPYAWLAQPPRMPSFVQGVLNLGGVAVPVLRLDRLLGLPDGEYGLGASILIMKTAAQPLGLLVEHVDDVRSSADFQVLPVEETRSLQGCVIGQVHGAPGDIPLVSWQKLLLAEEQLRLAQFQDNAQRRLAELADAEW